MTEKPLVVIVGPTASGKSQLALLLAVALHGEIVNCDSVQVYQGLEIGAAKTPPSERMGIPHHLLDIAGPGAELTAGEYLRLGRAAIAEISSRPDRLPIIVGGTGLYLRALLEGLSEAPARNEELRLRLTRIAQKRPATLHRWLKRADENAAARIHSNDRQKLIRAVEMMLLDGRPLGEIHSRPRHALTGYRTLKLGLSPPRNELYAQIEARSERMFESGLLEETERLLAIGYSRESKPLLSLGYKQAVEVLVGQKTKANAVAELKTKTRRYAKRQLTWFRADQSIIWLSGFGSDPAVRDRSLHLAKEHLASNLTGS